MTELYEQLESTDKNKRMQAAEKLGNIRTKTALRALLDAAQNDIEKDVRKTAILSIEKLNDPEAIPVLDKIQNFDSDRGTRKAAKTAASKIRDSGKSLPAGDTDYTKADAKRAREDYRALEEHEAKQAGLYVKLQESFKYTIDRDSKIVDDEGKPIESLKGSGKVKVANTGNRDRIWAIDGVLQGVDEVKFPRDEEQETTVFGNTFSIKEIDPKGSQAILFEFETPPPKLKIIEDFWDLEKSDSPPLFSRGTETGMRFTIKLINEYHFPLKEIEVKKYILDPSTSLSNFKASKGSMGSDSDEEGEMIKWQIEEIPAGGEVEASCQLNVTLPEDTTEPYGVGATFVKYLGKEINLSGLKLDTITGSSSVFQYISREEQEENPGDFDCQFELENTSEFEMDLKEIRIYEGDLSEGNIRLEWLGADFPEEERSIDPGETFKLDPWTITVDEDGVIPQFGRELDLSVKYLYDAEIIAECVLPGYPLPFMAIEAVKTLIPLRIPSFRRTEIITENVIKSSGSSEITYLKVQDKIPEGFEPPKKDEVVISKNEEQLYDFDMDIADNNVILTIEHLEQTDLGALEQNEEMRVKFPYYAKAKPNEEFMGHVTILGNIYPQVKPVTAEADAGPITVIHERRKLKIGKMVSSTMNEDLNEYEIVIRGVNDGTAVIKNVEISDFLPSGFELVSDTIEEPPVGFEQTSSVKDGTALKWVYDEVQPNQKVEIRFKIKAPGEHDPKDVYKMLLG